MIGKNPKWYIGVLIVVALGAVASGVWEMALRPTFFLIIKILLKGCSLGLESATNDLYKSVALGRGSEFGMMFIFITLWSFVAVYWLFQKFHIETVEEKALMEMRKRSENATNSEVVNELEGEIKKAVEKQRKDKVFMRYFSLFVGYFVIIFSLFWGFFTIEREILRGQFDQYIAICGPYINERQKSQFHSQFYQMQTQEDYEKLLNELAEIAQKNKVTCPRILLF